MKLLTQDQAAVSIARVKQLGTANELTQAQAIEVIEHLDDLQYSYWKRADRADDPGTIRATSCQLRDTMHSIARDYGICTCCYLPFTVCSCDDHWMNHIGEAVI